MQKLIKIIAISLLMGSLCYGKIENHFKEWTHSVTDSTVKNVDFIYLINLDTRPEKLALSLAQLAPFGITPERFSAIYGWGLPVAVINDIGLRFYYWMWHGRENVLHFPNHWNGSSQFIALSDDCHGATVFSSWMTPGAIGCTMSHLSVLHDAYDSGFETIWVLEDDFQIDQNPHKLSDFIEELDAIAGKENWDILYTDCDYLQGLDASTDLLEQVPMKWRPDMPFFDLEPLLEHTPVGNHFLKIKCRNRTHSIIIRRSGMKKILEFYQDHQIFLPIDHELSFIPDLHMYVLTENIVSSNETCSDTKNRHFEIN